MGSSRRSTISAKQLYLRVLQVWLWFSSIRPSVEPPSYVERSRFEKQFSQRPSTAHERYSDQVLLNHKILDEVADQFDFPILLYFGSTEDIFTYLEERRPSNEQVLNALQNASDALFQRRESLLDWERSIFARNSSYAGVNRHFLDRSTWWNDIKRPTRSHYRPLYVERPLRNFSFPRRLPASVKFSGDNAVDALDLIQDSAGSNVAPKKIAPVDGDSSLIGEDAGSQASMNKIADSNKENPAPATFSITHKDASRKSVGSVITEERMKHDAGRFSDGDVAAFGRGKSVESGGEGSSSRSYLTTLSQTNPFRAPLDHVRRWVHWILTSSRSEQASQTPTAVPASQAHISPSQSPVVTSDSSSPEKKKSRSDGNDQQEQAHGGVPEFDTAVVHEWTNHAVAAAMEVADVPTHAPLAPSPAAASHDHTMHDVSHAVASHMQPLQAAVSSSPDDAALRGYFSFIARTSNPAKLVLGGRFDDLEDLETYAYANGNVEDLELDAKERTRMNLVLIHIRCGGEWRDGLSHRDMHVFVSQQSSSSPQISPSESTGPSSTATQAHGSQSVVPRVSMSPPKGDTADIAEVPSLFTEDFDRMEGGQTFEDIGHAALTETKIELNLLRSDYAEGVRDSILDELERKTGARLNKSNVNLARDRLYWYLNCKAKTNTKMKCACDFQLKVETPRDDPASTKVYIKGEHKCNPKVDYGTKQGGLTKAQKDYIQPKLASGDAPSQVLRDMLALNSDQCDSLGLFGNDGKLPLLPQVQSFQTNRAKDGDGVSVSTVDHVREICESLMSVPEDDDQPFVLHYHITSVDDFQIAMSTKKLLRKLKETPRRAVDGTYKLLKSGFPVLIMGVDDAERHFHPVVYAVAGHETGKDFKFLAKAVSRHVPNRHKALQLMADAAAAIRNGLVEAATEDGEAFDDTFNDIIDGSLPGDGAVRAEICVKMCYFHMMKACNDQANGRSKAEKSGKLVNADNWGKIREDVTAMHNIPHPYEQAFEYALKLFCIKWRAQGESRFVDYFIEQWGGDVRRWSSCHHPPGYASCNNGLERNNRWIKLIARHRRQYLIPFIESMQIQLKIWSTNSKEIITPSTRPPLTGPDWANEEKHVRDRGEIGVLENEAGDTVYVPSTKSFQSWVESARSNNGGKDSPETVNSNVVKARDVALSRFLPFLQGMSSGERGLSSLGINTFDDFVAVSESFYVVKPLPPEERRADMHHSCSCPDYSKHAKCKHSTHVGLKSKKITRPTGKLNIDGKAKKGRPRKTSKPLEKQPKETSK